MTETKTTRRNLLATAGIAVGSWLGDFALAAAPRPTEAVRLRPPGAVEENRFLSVCTRCALCVEACPPQALSLAGPAGGTAVGTPFFRPRETSCDLCSGYDTLKCIDACPTEALLPLARPRDVRIGTARIDTERCFAWTGVSCRACWHACPFPNEAIVFDLRGRAVVDEEACVGCGLCEHACLTEPTSIVVEAPSRAPAAVTQRATTASSA